MDFTSIQKSFLLLVACFSDIFAFNMEPKKAQIFHGHKGSLFGFSVVLFDYQSSFWLYIGAPKEDENSYNRNSSVITYGQFSGRVKMCSSTMCDNIQVGVQTGYSSEMFGFSMDFVPKSKDKDGRMIFCSPMWTDEKKYIKGLCIESGVGNNKAVNITMKGIPLHGNKVLIYNSAGFSLHSMNDAVFYGVPGYDSYKGQVFRSESPNTVDEKIGIESKGDSLTGYSIYSGKFTEHDTKYLIVGSPKYNESGRVDIFRTWKMSSWTHEGEQIGSYFGATICATDIDGNGKEDLFVAAPAYTTKSVSEGRVLLFLSESTSSSLSFKGPIILTGSLAANARFGTSISNVGDLDKDSFNDIAIGAPFEEDNTGCVYIYNGCSDGKISKYSQRILGSQVKPSFRGFGWAISKSVDTDKNGYQDFAVGAVLSDNVAILKGRPILKIFMNLTNSPEKIPLNLTEHDKINITIHFKYTIKGNTFPSLSISYTLVAEPNFLPKTERLLLSENIHHGTSKVRNILKGNVLLESNKTKEIQVFGVLQPGISDFISPIELRLTNTFRDKMIENGQLNPILKQKKVLVRRVIFAKDCGQDDICRSDLTLLLTAMNEVIVNQTKKIEFKVVVGNDGQNAFLTTAKFFTENNLRFMGVRMLQQNRRVDCLEWENTVECHVANPLMRNTNIKFVLMYQLPYINISVIEKGIWLHGNVSTKSSDINKLNKQWAAKVKLNMKAVPELTVNSEAFPVKYTKSEAISLNGSEVMSIYFDIHNLGPSSMPMTWAIFQIPMSLPNGNILFTDNDIEVQDENSNSQLCEFLVRQNTEDSSSSDKDVTIPGKMTLSTVNLGEGTSYISETLSQARDTIQEVAKCPDTMCSILQCPVPEIRAGNKIRFILKLNFTNAREALQTVDYLEISPDIKLEQNEGTKYLLPWTEQPNVKIYRRFVAEMPPGRPMNYIWVSAASSAGAICFVMIVWFLIWKYKCCVTKKHTEVKLMKRESLKRRTMRQVSRESGRYTPREPGSPF